MPFRQIPQSIKGYRKAMDDAKSKSESSPEQAITPPTLVRLNTVKPQYDLEISEMNAALQDQVNATLAEDSAMVICRMFVSHFFQVFNLGIARDVYPASARAYYDLDVNQEAVPVLTKENDVTYWALRIKDGEAARVAAGGVPMVNPSAAEVDVKYLDFKAKRYAQTEKKDKYDNELQDVSAMLDTVKKLVTDMWDEIEFYFRTEPDEASKRRKCREWGVVYVSRQKAKITGLVTNASTGTPLENVNVSIVEAEDTVQTDVDGNYELRTDYTGEGTLEFSLEGFVTQTFPVEVSEGGEYTQDVQLQPV